LLDCSENHSSLLRTALAMYWWLQEGVLQVLVISISAFKTQSRQGNNI